MLHLGEDGSDGRRKKRVGKAEKEGGSRESTGDQGARFLRIRGDEERVNTRFFVYSEYDIWSTGGTVEGGGEVS